MHGVLKDATVGQTARTDLLRLINGFQVSQAIHVAASLGLADLLASESQSSAKLAETTATDPASLYRMMRALASIGILREHEGRRFSLTAMGDYLRSDNAGTLAPAAIMIGGASFWRSWGSLLHSVRTGGVAFDHVHGRNVWAYRADHPEESAVFDRAMAAGTERFADAVLAVCDFSRFCHVADVGGGDGVFLAKILAAYPSLTGTLFDQPHVIGKVSRALTGHDVAARCDACAGDFFVSVPESDAYVLKWILHDWDDAEAVRILKVCRAAISPDGRLFIVEFVIDSPNAAPESKYMDLMMMVMNGGRERTRNEFATLLTAAGFCITDVTLTSSSLSVIECRPV